MPSNTVELKDNPVVKRCHAMGADYKRLRRAFGGASDTLGLQDELVENLVLVGDEKAGELLIRARRARNEMRLIAIDAASLAEDVRERCNALAGTASRNG